MRGREQEPIRQETQYEKDQRFNWLVFWLHSFRYRAALSVLAPIARHKAGRKLRVVEIGCAHARLYSVLDGSFDIDYTGIEIDPLFVQTARFRHGGKPNFMLIHESATTALSRIENPDVIFALETLEHIPEPEVVRIVETIAALRPQLFVCSVPIEIGPAVWLKNIGSFLTGYMRHREYSWRETFWAGLYRLDKLPPHTITHKGFDWRWLAQVIRRHMRVVEIRKFPLGFLPAAFAFTAFLVAEPRDK